jgi:uncharacterized lipoprotein
MATIKEKKGMKLIRSAIIAFAAVLALAGCQTMTQQDQNELAGT